MDENGAESPRRKSLWAKLSPRSRASRRDLSAQPLPPPSQQKQKKRLFSFKVLTPRGSSTGSAALPPPTTAPQSSPAPSAAEATTQPLTPQLVPRSATPPAHEPVQERSSTPPITFEITVPDNIKAGDRIQATTPTGLKVKLSVPQGAAPGTILTFALPASADVRSERSSHAAALIQARTRGISARQSLRSGVGQSASFLRRGGSADEVRAATAMQSSFRGHVARNDQQEAARQQWMKYYLELGHWEDALALSVTPEEEARIRSKQAGSVDEEGNRQKWFRHFLATRNFEEAEGLVVSQYEAAEVVKARAAAALSCFAACIGEKSSVEAEDQRHAMFVQAIRDYDWKVADTLASSDAEMQDISDSKLRVGLLTAALEAGDLALASDYAITNEEYERVSGHRKVSAGSANGSANGSAVHNDLI